MAGEWPHPGLNFGEFGTSGDIGTDLSAQTSRSTSMALHIRSAGSGSMGPAERLGRSAGALPQEAPIRVGRLSPVAARRMLGAVAGAVSLAVLAAALSSCSHGPAPFDHPTSSGGQCIPLAGAKVVTDGLEMIQNRATTVAVIDRVALRRPKGLLLDRAWVVPTDAQLYGAAHGYPPQHYFKVVGWHWDRRQLADGARVPPLSTHEYFRMNIVIVVRLAPG